MHGKNPVLMMCKLSRAWLQPTDPCLHELLHPCWGFRVLNPHLRWTQVPKDHIQPVGKLTLLHPRWRKAQPLLAGLLLKQGEKHHLTHLGKSAGAAKAVCGRRWMDTSIPATGIRSIHCIIMSWKPLFLLALQNFLQAAKLAV